MVSGEEMNSEGILSNYESNFLNYIEIRSANCRLTIGNPGSLRVPHGKIWRTYEAKFWSENLLENGNKNRRNLPCSEVLLSLIRTRSFGKNGPRSPSLIV